MPIHSAIHLIFFIISKPLSVIELMASANVLSFLWVSYFDNCFLLPCASDMWITSPWFRSVICVLVKGVLSSHYQELDAQEKAGSADIQSVSPLGLLCSRWLKLPDYETAAVLNECSLKFKWSDAVSVQPSWSLSKTPSSPAAGATVSRVDLGWWIRSTGKVKGKLILITFYCNLRELKWSLWWRKTKSPGASQWIVCFLAAPEGGSDTPLL